MITLQRKLQMKKLRLIDFYPFFVFGLVGVLSVVHSSISYQKIDDHYFTNSTNMVYAIADGVCVYLNESEQGYQIIVKNDNDILVTYANMNDVSVKVDDRILKNSIIGTYQDKLYMDFMDNQNFISYEQAIGKN